MTLQERKLKLITQLSTTENKKLIKEIELLLKKTIIEEYERTLKEYLTRDKIPVKSKRKLIEKNK